MTLALYDYQVEGGGWLAGRTLAYLADEMRLGKSPQAVEAVNLRQHSALRVVVICPAYLRITWRRMIATWAWWPWDATVLSYEEATRFMPEADLFIFDEAHYLSNPEAKRTIACLGLADNVLLPGHPLRRAKYIWALSGTPGDPSKVWTWCRVFGVTKAPWLDWTMRYCVTRTTEYGLQVMGLKAFKVDEFKTLTGPYFKRRTALDVRLPVARWGVLSLACGVDNGDTRVDPDGDWPEPDEWMATQMRELGERKVKPLVHALSEELASGELGKVVVWGWHTKALYELTLGLCQFGSVLVDGSMTENQKQAAVDKFNQNPACRVFVGQIKAAGVGNDLAAASDAVFAELSWNPDDNLQAAARILGPNQTRPAMVRVAASEDPLDYALARVCARKSQTTSTTWS